MFFRILRQFEPQNTIFYVYFAKISLKTSYFIAYFATVLTNIAYFSAYSAMRIAQFSVLSYFCACSYDFPHVAFAQDLLNLDFEFSKPAHILKAFLLKIASFCSFSASERLRTLLADSVRHQKNTL